jgi:hypothetical protein
MNWHRPRESFDRQSRCPYNFLTNAGLKLGGIAAAMPITLASAEARWSGFEEAMDGPGEFGEAKT